MPNNDDDDDQQTVLSNITMCEQTIVQDAKIRLVAYPAVRTPRYENTVIKDLRISDCSRADTCKLLSG